MSTIMRYKFDKASWITISKIKRGHSELRREFKVTCKAKS